MSQWNLSTRYTSIDDPSIQKDLQESVHNAKEWEEKYTPPLGIHLDSKTFWEKGFEYVSKNMIQTLQ